MKILLDSHVVVWWLGSPEKLTPRARALIADPANQLTVSAASIWELHLKLAKGTLQMPSDFVEHLWDGGFEELPVRASHVSGLADLPSIHQDPFDRLLMAQAVSEGLQLMTRDRIIHQYPVPLLPC